MTTPFNLRVRGLSNKLSSEEFAIVLYHLAKRRCIHNVENENNIEAKSKISTKAIIGTNSKEE